MRKRPVCPRFYPGFTRFYPRFSQQTVKEEGKRVNGVNEVTIPTLGGKKETRRADAVGTNPTTGQPEIVQVYRADQNWKDPETRDTRCKGHRGRDWCRSNNGAGSASSATTNTIGRTVAAKGLMHGKADAGSHVARGLQATPRLCPAT